MVAVRVLHPRFDLTMELLCSLPPGNEQWGGALVSAIVSDMGFRPGEFDTHFHRLKTRYTIEQFDYYGDLHVAVVPSGWKQARKAAQEYWDEVYGATQAVNTIRLTG